MSRDFQRTKVYAWENVLWAEEGSEFMATRLDARRFFRAVCKQMGCPELRIGFRSGGSHSFYNADWNGKGPTIRIATMTKGHILHEIAHRLIDVQYPKASDHGPEFVATLAGLFVVYTNLDAQIVMRGAAEFI